MEISYRTLCGESKLSRSVGIVAKLLSTDFVPPNTLLRIHQTLILPHTST